MRRALLAGCLLLWAAPVFAQISAGNSAESHAGTTASTSQASFDFATAFNGGSSPEGVAVCTYSLGSATNKATAVTYGGESMTAVAGGEATRDGTEDVNAKLWFLSSPPTGSVTITVTRTNDATPVWASAFAVEAATAAETEVYAAGIVLVQTASTAAEQNVDDGSPGTNSLRFACIASGADATDDVGANSSASAAQIDIGTMTARMVFETTAGQGSRPVGSTDTTNVDRAIVHFAVRQVAAAGGSPPRPSGLALGVF